LKYNAPYTGFISYYNKIYLVCSAVLNSTTVTMLALVRL
jgi:hypothetical protein